MEHLDIIIGSSVLVVLFATFIGMTIKELNNSKPDAPPSEETGPRANLIKFIGKLFDSPVITKEQAESKLVMYNEVYAVMSDMESDGVYFPEDIKNDLIKKREELKCHYSDLPSVASYGGVE